MPVQNGALAIVSSDNDFAKRTHHDIASLYAPIFEKYDGNAAERTAKIAKNGMAFKVFA